MNTLVNSSSASFYSISEAAKQLGASYWFVRSEISRGRLPAHRFGTRLKIAGTDLARYIEKRRVPKGEVRL
jgi:excisionase family DNA binding protein